MIGLCVRRLSAWLDGCCDILRFGFGFVWYLWFGCAELRWDERKGCLGWVDNIIMRAVGTVV